MRVLMSPSPASVRGSYELSRVGDAISSGLSDVGPISLVPLPKVHYTLATEVSFIFNTLIHL